MGNSKRLIKIRPHRGSLIESMREAKTIEPTAEAIAAVINRTDGFEGFIEECLPEEVTVEHYVDNERDPEWNQTFIVKFRGNVFGFTNGPIDPPLRYVWLNIVTGEFSDSWQESDFSIDTNQLIADAIKDTKPDERASWKLIEYRCLTDGDFQFDRNMRLP